MASSIRRLASSKGASTVHPAAAAWPPPPRRAQTFVALTRGPVRRENFHTSGRSSRMVTAQSTPSICPPRAERSSASVSVAWTRSMRAKGTDSTAARSRS